MKIVIYKNDDRSATVTLYVSTGNIHVQGPAHAMISENLLKLLKDSDILTEASVSFMDKNSEEPNFNEETEIKRLVGAEIRSSTPIEYQSQDIEHLKRQIGKLNECVNRLKKRLQEIEIQKVKSNAETQTEDGTIQVEQQKTSSETQTDMDMACSHPRMTGSHAHAVIQVDLRKKQELTAREQEKKPTYAEVLKSRNEKNASRYLRNSETLQDKGMESKQDATLIIGSSLLQRINPRGLQSSVQVRTRRGAWVSRIRKELGDRRVEHYGNIIIQAGGNDVDSGREIEAIENDFVEIIKDIHARSPKTEIYIAEVLPRRRCDVSEINAILQHVCKTYGAKLVETTKAIKEVNAVQFWEDRVHLSDKGTRDLLFVYNEYLNILKSDEKRRTNHCYNCGERGHVAKNCRHYGKIQCWECGQTGHKMRHCRNY
ncbi:hypothetical protein FSP39_017619 [Pinctada imbricata]|uniref:CCHC-type domain-containing protein n=1 Tax=Pinctada imbricata TaxID=66713 RepID=A0AA89C1N6_PINIB|nr:hypothetical protein FSP39_017619 [Pinctada imbricata]